MILATNTIVGSARFDADAEAFFLRASIAGSPFDSARKYLITNLFLRLKREKGTDGVTSQWDSLDVLNLIAAHSQVVGLMNIKTSAFGNITMNVAGSYTVDKGLKGNGSSTRGDTNFNPFDGGAYKFTLDDNSFGVYMNTNTKEIKGLVSNLDGSSNGYELRTHTLQAVAINGGTTANNTLYVDATGMISTRRVPGTNQFAVYKNHKTDALTSLAVTSTVNKTFKLFCRDINGVFSLFTLNRFAYTFFGGSNIDVQKLDRAVIEEYLKPIGAALVKRVIFDGNSFLAQQTMPISVMDQLWNAGIECTSLFNAVGGINISTMTTNAPTRIDPYKENYFTKEVFLFQEITNSMQGAAADVNVVFANLVTYFTARRNAGLSMPIICNTCPPRKSTDVTVGIWPSKRDNVSDIYDSTKINGKIRSGLATLGVQAASDETYDPIFLDSGGVAGVGEKNTTYFQTDEIHLTSTGYIYVATNHILPKALTYLT